MAKNTCEASKRIPISYLKKHGFLSDDYRSGSIVWRSVHGESSIGITVNLLGGAYMQAKYERVSWDGNREVMDYKIKFTTTSCHFGGWRYWFICPLIKNGVPCEKRVGVLYMVGKYLACRQCYDLAYESQQESRSYGLLGPRIFSKLDEKEEKMRVKYWKGEATKRYARLLKKREKEPSIEVILAQQEAALERLRR